jgi:hypothetical protein
MTPEAERLVQVVLHPKSVYQVPGVWHGVAQLGGFHPGVDLLHGEEAREEVLDRVRFFAEDCDSLQVGLWLQHLTSCREHQQQEALCADMQA